MKIFIYIVILILSCAVPLTAQEKGFLNKSGRNIQVVPAQKVFQEIEAAIAAGNTAALSGFLGSQTYFSLASGSSGYYSFNQAFYVLENFFNVYQVRAFRFNNLQAVDNNPYATGIYAYESKGKRDTARVYVSLKLIGNHWKITQITIN